MQIKDSERLRYAMMGESDVDLLFELDQDPEVMRFLTDGRPTPREEILSKAIPRMKSYTEPEKGWGVWKVLLKEHDDEFIGWVLIRPMDFFNDRRDDTNLEIGWRFMRRFWGNGYATEAAKSISDSILATGNYDRLSAIAHEANAGSINVMKRLGMSFVKVDADPDPPRHHSCVFYERAYDRPRQ
ncbi:MAG: GNAT family N-acetyltransferase [Planctomycetota bacterium]